MGDSGSQCSSSSLVTNTSHEDVISPRRIPTLLPPRTAKRPLSSRTLRGRDAQHSWRAVVSNSMLHPALPTAVPRILLPTNTERCLPRRRCARPAIALPQTQSGSGGGQVLAPPCTRRWPDLPGAPSTRFHNSPHSLAALLRVRALASKRCRSLPPRL
jgi:hypothetical protein